VRADLRLPSPRLQHCASPAHPVPIELSIQVGDAPPRVESYEGERITLGRDPSSDVRFDLNGDLQVSTRHAEILRDEDGYYLIDRDSTNGTWVNGGRVREPSRLRAGHLIVLGTRGPVIRVLRTDDEVWHETVQLRALPPVLNASLPRSQRTQEMVAAIVERRMRRLGLALAAAVVLILGVGAVGWLNIRSGPGDSPDVWREVTVPALRRANEGAVALLEVRIAGTACASGCEGTGFVVDSSGLLVTNRHVVVQDGREASALRVKFANSATWITAQLIGVHPDPRVDLALVQLAPAARYPTVAGVSETGLDLPIGSTVLTVGFPLGTALRMDGAGEGALARTTTTTGAVARVLADLIQIDASATHGSSGSPVFDRHGHAIGVVTGGAGENNPNIVYLVPASRVGELLQAHGQRRELRGTR
jgi:S1-C subfamily serine protease